MKMLENKKAEAKVEVTAGARPDFTPTFVAPYLKVRKKAGKVQYNEYGDPIYDVVQGTFFDIIRNPTVKASLTELRKAQYNAKRRAKKVAGETGKTRGRKGNVKEACSLYHYSDMAYRGLQRILDVAVPQDARALVPVGDEEAIFREEPKRKRRKKAIQDDFGGDSIAPEDIQKAPLDFYSEAINFNMRALWRQSGIFVATNKVRVKDEGAAFEVSLPIASLNFSDYLSPKFVVPPMTSSEGIYSYYHNAYKHIKRLIGINLEATGRVESFVSYDGFTKLVKESGHYVDIPALKKAEANYIKGVRVIADPVSTDVEMQIQRLTASLEMALKDLESIKDRDNQSGKGISSAPNGSGKFGAIDIVDEFADEFSEDDSTISGSDDFEADLYSKYKEVERGLTLLNKAYEGYLNRQVNIYLAVRLPRVEAEYYTQTPEQEIKPTYVLEFFRSLYKNFWVPLNEYFYPLESIEKLNVGFEAPARQNKDGIGVTKNNEALYIPVVNNIQQYSTLSEKIAKTSTGELTFDPVDGVDINLLANQVIYTDWVNNKLAYTDRNGNLRVYDLEDVYEIRPHSVVSLLDISPDKFFSDAKGTSLLGYLAQRFFQGTGESFARKLSEEYKKFFNDAAKYVEPGSRSMDFLEDISSWWESKIENAGDVTNSNLYKDFMQALYKYEAFRVHSIKHGESQAFDDIMKFGDSTNDEGVTKVEQVMSTVSVREMLTDSPFAIPLNNTINYFVEKVLKNFNDFAYKSKPNDIIYLLKVFSRFYAVTIYSPRYREFVEKDRKEREIYLTYDSAVGDPNYVPALPNVGDERVLKHFQYRALSILDKSPEFSILAVDAGGGKTITILSNVLQELQKGKVRKPLIICPGHLVKDYIGEVNYFNEAKMNAVIVNNLTVKNYGKEKLLALVRNAPPNTVFIADYGAFSIGASIQTYLNDDIADYRYLDFYRQCGFDGVWLDESHYIKNDSQRYHAIRYAIAEIPIKRLATGTLAPNRLKDIVRQFSLFDPTVFGSEEQFNKLLEDTDKGVIPKEIMARLKGFCSLINIKRREWAYSLPPRIQSFDPPAQLTKNQEKLYDWLCAREKDRLMMMSNISKDLEKLLGGKGSDDIDDRKRELDEDSEESQVEIEEKGFAELDRHISHIEMFLSAPRAHPLAKLKVNGVPILENAEDLRSPKADLIEYHYRNHQHFLKTGQIKNTFKSMEAGEDVYDDAPMPGAEDQNKILVFTNWRVSVEHLYQDLPADIRSHTMKYRAANKVADFNDFKNKPEMKMMIGIGKSMNTGLNLQFCSRLIFVEAVWAPGELEQSLARVFRPVKVGKKEQRTRVFINHLIVDRTIDVYKTSNLISKWVEITKTMNADNPLYDRIPHVEELPLSLDKMLIDKYTFDEDLVEHAQAFMTLIATEHEDFRQFAEQHKGQKELFEVINAGNLEGSRILSKIPYVPGMSLYTNEDLNLVPYGEWKNERLLEDPNFRVEQYVAEAGPVFIHTEYGDGELVKEGTRKSGKKSSKVLTEREDDDSEASSDNNIFDEDGYVSISAEDFNSGNIDLKKLMDDIEDNLDSKSDISGASKKKVHVRFRMDTSDFDPKDLKILEDNLHLLSDTDKANLERHMNFTMAFDPDTIFVILNSSLDYENARAAAIDAIKGIDDIQDSDITFKEHVDNKRLDFDRKKADIQKLLATINKKRKKAKNKRLIEEEKEKERESKRKKQITEDKKNEEKKRGRPRKDETIPPEYDDSVMDVEDDEKDGVIDLYIAQNRDMLSLSVSADDPDVDIRTLNKVMRTAKFTEAPAFIAIQLRLPQRTRDFLDEIAPVFEDGTPITPDTPVVSDPDSPNWVQKGKNYVHSKTKQKVPVEDFDNGYYVDKKSELPKFYLDEESFELVNDLYDAVLDLRGKKRISVTRETLQKVVSIKRQNLRKAPPNTLRCYPITMRNENGYSIYLCVPIKNNHAKIINEVKRLARSKQLPIEKRENDLVAFYPNGNKAALKSDIRALMEHYDIGNLDEVNHDYKGLIVRGRPSAKDEF